VNKSRASALCKSTTWSEKKKHEKPQANRTRTTGAIRSVKSDVSRSCNDATSASTRRTLVSNVRALPLGTDNPWHGDKYASDYVSGERFFVWAKNRRRVRESFLISVVVNANYIAAVFGRHWQYSAQVNVRRCRRTVKMKIAFDSKFAMNTIWTQTCQ